MQAPDTPAEPIDLLPFPARPGCYLRIGVTGHRPHSGRVFDATAVNSALAAVFTDIEFWFAGYAMPDFSQKPRTLSLISALAEGADQMAVDVFFGRDTPAEIERRLEAVLPFATDAYAESFHTPEGVARMQAQQKLADTVLTLADWSPHGPGKANVFATHWRDQRFATIGDIIVRQSDLLIAVWDGMTGSGPGGTAHVVARAVADRVPVVSIHPRTGALTLITKHPFPDPSAGSAGEGSEILSNDLFLAYDRLAKSYAPERLDIILSDIMAPPSEPAPSKMAGLRSFLEKEPVRPHTRAALYHWLFNGHGKNGARTTGPARLSIATDHVRRSLASPVWRDVARLCGDGALFRPFAAAWAHADAVATRLGHHYRSTYVAIFCVAALATLSGLMGLPMTLLGANEMVFVAAEFLILCAGLVIYWSGRAAQQHRRWLNAREVSEQMRAHWALALIGLGGRRAVADAGWAGWLFNAYASAVGVPNLTADSAALARIARFIRSDIVEDQARYHQKNAHILEFNHKKLEIVGNLALLLAMGSSIALIVYLLNEHYFENDLFRLGMVAASAALPSIGAAATGIRFQGDFERFAWRSGQTYIALMRLDQQLEHFIESAEVSGAHKPHYEDLRDIVTRLETVLLSDLDDWRFVYEARPDPGVG